MGTAAPEIPLLSTRMTQSKDNQLEDETGPQVLIVESLKVSSCGSVTVDPEYGKYVVGGCTCTKAVVINRTHTRFDSLNSYLQLQNNGGGVCVHGGE